MAPHRPAVVSVLTFLLAAAPLPGFAQTTQGTQRQPPDSESKPAASSPFEIKGFRIGDTLDSVKSKLPGDVLYCEPINSQYTACLLPAHRAPPYYRTALGHRVYGYAFDFYADKLARVSYSVDLERFEALRSSIAEVYGAPAHDCSPSSAGCDGTVWRSGGTTLQLTWGELGLVKKMLAVVLEGPQAERPKKRDF